VEKRLAVKNRLTHSVTVCSLFKVELVTFRHLPNKLAATHNIHQLNEKSAGEL